MKHYRTENAEYAVDGTLVFRVWGEGFGPTRDLPLHVAGLPRNAVECEPTKDGKRVASKLRPSCLDTVRIQVWVDDQPQPDDLFLPAAMLPHRGDLLEINHGDNKPATLLFVTGAVSVTNLQSGEFYWRLYLKAT